MNQLDKGQTKPYACNETDDQYSKISKIRSIRDLRFYFELALVRIIVRQT